NADLILNELSRGFVLVVLSA
ncbi:hypothetical protein SLEP1_g59985, partial [Rubroshorea leprosula]